MTRYRFAFPPTKWSTIPATVASSLIQHLAIVAEVEEVRRAIIDPLGTRHHICVELMDTLVAVETELRKQQRIGVDLDSVYDEVLEKNDRRSYWIGETP